MEENDVGRILRVLLRKMNRTAHASMCRAKLDGITAAQGRIIAFLWFNRDRSIFQKDVEAEFSITRATASKTLSRMEENGYITRHSVAGDARLKRLKLTERAAASFRSVREEMEKVDRLFLTDFTPEETATFIRLLQKAEHNLDHAATAAPLKGEQNLC